MSRSGIMIVSALCKRFRISRLAMERDGESEESTHGRQEIQESRNICGTLKFMRFVRGMIGEIC